MSPAVVFVDEIDALAGSRDNSDNTADRRVVTTLLAQLDGFQSKSDDSLVITMASTNIPWALDDALLSRFHSKVYLPLPSVDDRAAIIKLLLNKADITSSIDVSRIAKQCDNFSGREISQLVQRAIRSMVLRTNRDLEIAVDKGLESTRNYQIKSESISESDWSSALGGITPVSNQRSLEKFEDWARIV
jgi:katanin p60 ATPase-containing subunit A1